MTKDKDVASRARQGYTCRLGAEVENGALVIRIGSQTLAHAVTYAPWAQTWDDDASEVVRTFAITDAKGFANDVRLALLNEREDGSSLLTDLLDKASEAAVDDGSLFCEYEQRIVGGATAPCETWAVDGGASIDSTSRQSQANTKENER